jgi:hypothetical protein
MVGTSPSMMDHLPAFSKRQIFQWSEEDLCPGRTYNFIKDFQSWTAWKQTTTRQTVSKVSTCNNIFSRVKFWVRTTKNFNQRKLSLLPHGVHHPRRTSCILFLNLSSLPPSKLFMGPPKCRESLDQFTLVSDLHLDDPLHRFFKNQKFFTGLA